MLALSDEIANEFVVSQNLSLSDKWIYRVNLNFLGYRGILKKSIPLKSV